MVNHRSIYYIYTYILLNNSCTLYLWSLISTCAFCVWVDTVSFVLLNVPETVLTLALINRGQRQVSVRSFFFVRVVHYVLSHSSSQWHFPLWLSLRPFISLVCFSGAYWHKVNQFTVGTHFVPSGIQPWPWHDDNQNCKISKMIGAVLSLKT